MKIETGMATIRPEDELALQNVDDEDSMDHLATDKDKRSPMSAGKRMPSRSETSTKRKRATMEGLTGKQWEDLKCHEKVYNVMFDPNSGTAAKLFTGFMSMIVVVSIVMFCMGTMPEYSTPEKAVPFNTADDIFNIVFTIEFVVRVAVILPRGSCPQKELVDFFMVVDFLAILPAIIGWCTGTMPFQPRNDEFGSWATAFLLLKSLKSLRLLKLLRFFNEAVILTKALKKSGPALMVPAFAIIITATVAGSFVFVFETVGQTIDPDGPGAAFDSIPHTMWFMFVTMTTIGYGDVSPTTHLGKAMTVPVMVFGVLLISMPLAVVGNNFTEVWAEKDKVIFVEKLREAIASQGIKANAIQVAFKELDTDNSGTISFKEFKNAIKALQISMPSGDVLKLWRSIDTDNSGEILVNELVEMISVDGSVKEAAANPVFRAHSERFGSVFVLDSGRVHYRAEDDLAGLPKGSVRGFHIQWLKSGNVTEEVPDIGPHSVDYVDDDNTIFLVPTHGGDIFSFDNPNFVFCKSNSKHNADDDRVYLSNAEGFVDNVNADPIGYHVEWKDTNGDFNFPKAHPVGFEIIDIDEDQTVTCRVESTSALFTFHNPVRDNEFKPPTGADFEARVSAQFAKMDSRFDTLEASLAAIMAKL